MTVTMEAMEATLARMMKDIAKRHDVGRFGEHTKDCEPNTEKVEDKVGSHAAQLNDLRRELDLLKAKGSPTTASASSGETWRPRLVHARGWDPWGSRFSHKLNRAESPNLQKFIGDCMPEEWPHKTR